MLVAQPTIQTHRKRVYTEEKCTYCYGFRRAKGRGKRYLFRYYVEIENFGCLKYFRDPHLFCDQWCRNAYYRK